MIKYVLIIILSGALMACSDPPESEHRQPTATSSQPDKMKDNVFKDQVQVLDKAKGVEESVLQQADQQRKEVDEKTAQ